MLFITIIIISSFFLLNHSVYADWGDDDIKGEPPTEETELWQWKQRFAYIHEHASKAELALYCRVLCVTVQGYTKHVQSLQKPYKYAVLLASIEAILAEDIFNQNYGKRRIYEKLQLDHDCAYGYNTVAKVMRENRLLHQGNKPKGLTKADKLAQKSDNLLSRDFSATAPGEKVVTDITEWTACDGKLYLSGVFDCFDNMCLGISLADNMRTELCIEILESSQDMLCHRRHATRGETWRALSRNPYITLIATDYRTMVAASGCY